MWNRFTLAGARSASVLGITAVSRVPNSMEVWWVGTDSTVQGAYWYEGQPWKRYELAPAGSASAGFYSYGSITAVSRVPNSMEVWWVGTEASVQGAYWYEGQPWKRYELAPPGSASVDGSITAVSRVSNSMEVWWVGTEASVHGAYWYEGQPWKRYELAPAGSASVYGSITAVSRIPDSMEVWWVGTDASVRDAFWYAPSQRKKKKPKRPRRPQDPGPKGPSPRRNQRKERPI
jgi:hypothetical protein